MPKSLTTPAFLAKQIREFAKNIGVKIESIRAIYKDGIFTLCARNNSMTVDTKAFNINNAISFALDIPAIGIYLAHTDTADKRIRGTISFDLDNHNDKCLLTCQYICTTIECYTI